MTQTDETQSKKTRRRRTTYAKRLELRISDSERKDIEQLIEMIDAQTGNRLSLSEAVRMFIRDGGKQIEDAAKRATSPPSAHNAGRTAEALEEFAEELRMTRTEIRRIGHNLNQIAHWANTEHRSPTGLNDAQNVLTEIDKRLVAIAKKAVDQTTWAD